MMLTTTIRPTNLKLGRVKSLSLVNCRDHLSAADGTASLVVTDV